MAELATAEVKLEVDFAHLDEDLKKGLEQRVRKAAKTAQAELDKTELAAAALGTTIDKQVGRGADKAAAKIKKAAEVARSELGKATEAAGDTAAAVRDIADTASGTLFDFDDSGAIKLNHAIENVQTSLFDLDTVEIEGITAESDKAATSLRARLAAAADRARTSLLRIFRRDTGSQAAVDQAADLGETVTEIGKRADKSGSQLDRFSGRLGILVSAIAAGVAIAPAFVSGGLALAAFGAVAVPTLINVIKAQTEMSDRWAGLTRQEKIAAAQTNALVEEYKALAREVSPDVLRVYNGVLANTTQLLPKVKPLVGVASAALVEANQQIGEGLDSPRARDFFAFLEREGGPAVSQVVTVFLDLIAATASLVQALTPLATVGLGTVSMILRLLAAITDLSPELVQLAVLALALRSPLIAAGGALGKFSGAAKGASLATRGLNILQAAGPNLYVAAGAALVFFAIKALTAKTATDRLLASLRAQHQAVGNNIAGYRAYAAALEEKLAASNVRVAASFQNFQKEASITNAELLKGRLAAEDFIQVPVTAEQQRNAAAFKNVQEAAALLGTKYKITTGQAIALADAVGVNLSKGVVDNGQLVASAAGKFEAYAVAVRLAKDPTFAIKEAWDQANNSAIGLKKQIEGLQAVYDQYLTPALGVLDAQLKLDEVTKQVTSTLAKSTVTEQERLTLASQAIKSLQERAQAEFAATRRTEESTIATGQLLPKLSQLVGNSANGRAAMLALARSMEGATTDAKGAVTFVDRLGTRIKVLPNGKVIRFKAAGIGEIVTRMQTLANGVTVPVQFVQRGPGLTGRSLTSYLPGGATGGVFTGAKGFLRRAAGGPSGRVRGPGTGTSDSIPALLSNGEYVINAKQTRKHLALLHALNAGRFAAGGLVGKVQAFASGGVVQRFAAGGKVRKAALVDIGALLGDSIRFGLRGSDKAIAAEVERLRKSLEKKLVTIGQNVGAVFVKSLSGSPAEISRTLRTLERQITRAFTGIKTRVDDLLVKRLEVLNTRLSGLAKRRDTIAAQITDAKQLAASVTDRGRSFASVTGFDDDEQSSAATLAVALRDRLTKLRQFARDIQNLSARGLDKGIIRELVEGGPEQSGALARTLATSSRSALAEITSLQKQINKQTGAFGKDTADLLFDAGAAAGKGFLTGLKSEQAEIVKLMTEIAKSVSKTVKQTLKIKSPSRVLEADGSNSALGYIRGWERLRTRIRATVADSVRPDRTVQRASALRPAREASTVPAMPGGRQNGRTVTVHQTNHYHGVTADPDALFAASERRLLAAIR